MKRARRCLVWDQLELKINKTHCKHCNAVYTYNTTTTPMMYHLNNIHPTLVNESSSSSQPTITSVLAQRSCDAQRAIPLHPRNVGLWVFSAARLISCRQAVFASHSWARWHAHLPQQESVGCSNFILSAACLLDLFKLHLGKNRQH